MYINSWYFQDFIQHITLFGNENYTFWTTSDKNDLKMDDRQKVCPSRLQWYGMIFSHHRWVLRVCLWVVSRRVCMFWIAYVRLPIDLVTYFSLKIRVLWGGELENPLKCIIFCGFLLPMVDVRQLPRNHNIWCWEAYYAPKRRETMRKHHSLHRVD